MTITIDLTFNEYLAAQQLIKDTTNRHLFVLLNGTPVPEPTEQEKEILISMLNKLKTAFGL